MGQKYRMRLNGEETVVDSDEKIRGERAIDVFRKNGAVVLGMVGPSGELERPPAPTPLANNLTDPNQNLTGTRAEAMARGFIGGSVQAGADMLEGAGKRLMEPVRYGGDLIRRGLGMERPYIDPKNEEAWQVPNSAAGRGRRRRRRHPAVYGRPRRSGRGCKGPPAGTRGHDWR